ncbi:MAG: AIM24 family protein [Solirubrobacterales bacterium]|nr:AIM24 family protein [Solirubrobacterales bacterium]
MSVEQSLAQYRETESGESFSLQNSKLLKVELADVTIQAKLGAMVAYQGDVKFEHAGSGGLSRMLKKAVTNEGLDLMKISGSGEVFLADLAQEVQLIHLSDDFITANGANVLAFDAGIDWDVRRVEGVSGMLGGGLYNMELKGSGWVALVSNGTPMMLEVSGEDTFADPNAAITWSSGLKTDIKTDVNLKTLIGRSSGETIQMAFRGQGWVLVQPSEAPPKGAMTATGGAQGGAAGGIGGLLNR